MRWALRILSGLCIVTFDIWTVGQGGFGVVNKNLCDLWKDTVGPPPSCQFNKGILWLWGIGALFAAVFLVFDFVRWLGSKVANNEASALRRLFASTGSARLVGAIAAFNRIVSKSRWAKRLRKHPEVMKRGPFETSHTEDENIQRRLELHLANEIHDKLRAGELTAWEEPTTVILFDEYKAMNGTKSR
jgi:hypothetical protein